MKYKLHFQEKKVVYDYCLPENQQHNQSQSIRLYILLYSSAFKTATCISLLTSVFFFELCNFGENSLKCLVTPSIAALFSVLSVAKTYSYLS